MLSSLSAHPVDISHPVYAFIHRLEMEGKVDKNFSGTMPWSKSDIMSTLQSAEENEKKAMNNSLTNWEKTQLAIYEIEFGLQKSNGKWINPFQYQDKDFSLAAKADFQSQVLILDSLPRAQTFGFGVLSGTLEGSYKNKLQFTSTAGLGQQRSLHPRFEENYNPQAGLPYNTDREGKAGIPREVSSLDFFRTVIGFEDRSGTENLGGYEKNIRLEFGSDWNQWGPGIWQHASLSQNPWIWAQDSLPRSDSVGFTGPKNQGGYRLGYCRPGESAPMTQMRLVLQMGPFSYTKILAERQGLWVDSLAHLIAHRLEFKGGKYVKLGMEEMVMTAGRSLDWTYAIPLLPLKFAEHELGDRDNIAIGFDAEVTIPQHGRIFGELLLDDFSGWDLNFWGNKFAYSFGAEGIGFFIQDALFQIEYAHVEPWVFTHHRRDNQMQHFGSLLGSSIPADAHIVHTAWEQPLRQDLVLKLEYVFMQRNGKARGASLFDYHTAAIDGSQKYFLDGIVETRNTVALGGHWLWQRNLDLGLQLGYLAVDNWKSESGVTLMSPLLNIEVSLHY